MSRGDSPPKSSIAYIAGVFWVGNCEWRISQPSPSHLASHTGLRTGGAAHQTAGDPVSIGSEITGNYPTVETGGDSPPTSGPQIPAAGTWHLAPTGRSGGRDGRLWERQPFGQPNASYIWSLRSRIELLNSALNRWSQFVFRTVPFLGATGYPRVPWRGPLSQ